MDDASASLDELLWIDLDEEAPGPRGTTKPRLTSVERMALDARWREHKMLEKSARKRLKRKLGRRPPRLMGPLVVHGPTVAIDLSYSDALPEREQRSVVSQATQSYGLNRHADRALDLHLVGTGCAGAAPHFARINGFECGLVHMCGPRCFHTRRSKWFVNKHADGALLNAFPGREADIVVLSPESPNVLDFVDEHKIYVLGGIAGECASLACASGY